VAKEIQACKALKEKLASEESAGIPVAILQKRDDAILRFSALKESSTLDDIKPVRAALENAERSIADFKDFLEFRRLADQTIARIETEMGLLIDIDDEIRKELEQRISNAKRALKSESFADAKQSVSELTNFYEAHSDELKFATVCSFEIKKRQSPIFPFRIRPGYLYPELRQLHLFVLIV
jgi:hypothetical protein